MLLHVLMNCEVMLLLRLHDEVDMPFWSYCWAHRSAGPLALLVCQALSAKGAVQAVVRPLPEDWGLQPLLVKCTGQQVPQLQQQVGKCQQRVAAPSEVPVARESFGLELVSLPEVQP